MGIVVAGLGYVGLPNAVLLLRKYEVAVTDTSAERIAMIEARKSPVSVSEITVILPMRAEPAGQNASDISAPSGAELAGPRGAYRAAVQSPARTWSDRSGPVRPAAPLFL